MGELLPVISSHGIVILIEKFLLLATQNDEVDELLEDPRIARRCETGDVSVSQVDASTKLRFLAAIDDKAVALQLGTLFDAWLAGARAASDD